MPHCNRHFLVLDTATDMCSVALSSGSFVYSESQLAPRAHTHIIFNMLERCLERANIDLSAITAIGFSAGPGSFTGVRLSAAVVQGLASGLSHPPILIRISTLALLAQQALTMQNLSEGTSIITILDARMNEIYAAHFSVHRNTIRRESPDQLFSAKAHLPFFSPDAVIIKDQYPLAEFALPLVEAAYEAGQGVAIAEAIPNYVREKVV